MKTTTHHQALFLAAATALLTAATVAPFSVPSANGGPVPGAVTGVVYHDMDGDGTRDPGEPGLGQREVHVMQGDTVIATGTSGDTGSYVAGNVPPGDYMLEADLDVGGILCADDIATFDPFPHSACFAITTLWRATAGLGPVTVLSGADTVVDIGAIEADAVSIRGTAILEDDYAPAGTLIEALVDGLECGMTGAVGGAEFFELHVLGEGERSGCATPGATVRFRVGGVNADQTYVYPPPSEPASGEVHLSAMAEHAWYWAETTPEMLTPGATVHAMIHDTVCGETVISTDPPLFGFEPFEPIAGFSKLIVPSNAVRPGCGTPGATVRFLVDGVEAGEVAWQPGVQRIDLAVQQLPSPTPTPEIDLPVLGAGGTSSEAWWFRWPVVAFAGALAVVIVGVGLVTRRGRV